MSYGMYISAAGADVQSRRLEVLAHNLANVDTPGFKREVAVLQARAAEAVERGERPAGTGGREDVGGGVRLPETMTALGQGPMKTTGRPTDLAIAVPNVFFLVDRDGQQLLTRAGDFRVAADGGLVTQQGDAVLRADGQPARIDPTLPWRLLENGWIDQGGVQFPLALVQPQSPADLARFGANYFRPLAPVRPAPPDQRRVLSGRLEQSAVRPTLEMIELIEASRAHQANVQMIQNHDRTLASLVNRVLRS